MSTTPRPPLLSDDDVRAISESESEFPDHWRDGFGYAETIYEAARAKDAELIQQLTDALKLSFCYVNAEIDPEFHEGQSALNAAAAAGFTPTEP